MADLDGVFRREWGPAVATLARWSGDLTVAEDAVQEAFAEALRAWPRDGVPTNPGGWVLTVARNRARDRLRRESIRPGKELAAVVDDITARTDRTERIVRLLVTGGADDIASRLSSAGAMAVRVLDLNLEDIFLYAVSPANATTDIVVRESSS